MIHLKIRPTQTHFPKLQNTKDKTTKTRTTTTKPSKGKNKQKVTLQRSKNYMSSSNTGH